MTLERIFGTAAPPLRWRALAVGCRIGLVLWLALLAVPATAQPVHAFLDRSTIYNGESLLLTIEADVGGASVDLDVSPLTRDFQILSSSRRQYAITGSGRARERFRWLVELAPRHPGQLELPALSITPRLATKPLTVTVLALPSGAREDRDVLIETTALPHNPYVQSQVRYRERVLLAAGVRLSDSQFNRSAPLRDAVLEPLGDFHESVTHRHGREYRVYQREFALIPQHSGTLVIPSLELHARVLSRNAGTTRGSQTGAGRLLTVRSAPLRLTVRPRPTQASRGNWLPSPALKLTEAWAQQPPRFQVGQPIGRKLSIEARGLEATQLPNIHLPAMAWARSYPEQTHTSTRHKNGWLIGRREQQLVIVPSQAGTFTLPAIRLPWWDTVDDRARVAELPARTVTVAPAPTAASPNPTPTPSPGPPTVTATGWLRYRLDAGLMALALVVLLAAWYERRRRAPWWRARQIFRSACRHNDPRAAARALLAWAALQWPDNSPRNLGELARRVPLAAGDISQLEQVLYAADAPAWRGSALWHKLHHGLPGTQHAVASRNPLPALYPAIGKDAL